MSPLLHSLAGAYAHAGALAALIDGTRLRSTVAMRKRSSGLSRATHVSSTKTVRTHAHALAGAAHARDDRDSLAA